MKKILKLFIFICISAFALNFIIISSEYNEDTILGDGLDTIIVDFDFNEDFASSPWKNIYVIWMEDTTSNFIQNIFICQKLIKGGLTGTALPFWKTNKYPMSSSSEVDAVTSATISNSDFSVSVFLKDSSIRNFDLYFEVDKPFDPNDWFLDQPAILYSVNINLDDNTSEYDLLPIGWTPNENTQNNIPNTPLGHLQEEMKYITHYKEGTTFGATDDRSSTKMVKKITVKIKNSIATNIGSSYSDDRSISLFPNPAQEQVNIKSNKVIQEIVITNLQGQMVLQIQPKTFETSFLLSKDIAPKGIYFAKVKTSKGTSTHKLLILE